MGRGMYKRKNRFNTPTLEVPTLQKKEGLYKVKIMHPSLRMRNNPNLNSEVKGLITDQGIYMIYEEQNGWGKLENNTWIMLEYTRKIK